MIHNSVKVFPIPTPHVKKMCKSFEGHLFILYIISSTRHLCSSLSFFIFVEIFSYYMCSSIYEFFYELVFYFFGLFLNVDECSYSLTSMVFLNMFFWGYLHLDLFH
jgi:hypothetical protein